MGADSLRLALSAEDGSVVHVVASGGDTHHQLSTLMDYVPPLGLSAVPEEASADLELVVRVDDPASLIRLESDLTVFTAEHLKNLVGVHSAGIVVEGHCVVFPGYSHSGKSALAREAWRRAWPVLTDEYCLIDPETGLVTGWPRKLRKREVDGSVTRISFDPATGSFPVGVICSVRYVQGTEGAQLEAISAGQGATELLSHVVCARRRPEDSLRAVAKVANQARAYLGTRGEASDFLDLLPAIVQG